MNWLQIALGQTYPGDQGWQGFNYQGKFDTWGYQPVSSNFRSNYNIGQMARSPYLSRVPAKHVEFTINHLAEKYYDDSEPHVVSSITDWCEGVDESWSWKACSCAEGTNQWHKEPEPGEGEDADTCWQNGERCGSISLGYMLKALDSEIDHITMNFAQKYEIPDREFIQNLAAFIATEVLSKISKQTQQNKQNETFSVRVYGINKAYGGPEEGGWWYNDKQVIEEEQAQGLQAACQLKQQLADKYEGKGQDSFNEDMANLHGGLVDAYDRDTSGDMGMGDVGSSLNESEGMEIPIGWTPSAFEKFIVQVELTDQPISQTHGSPGYS